MSTLSKQLENYYPDYEWWEDSIECYVEDLKVKGIDIEMEKSTRHRPAGVVYVPAISFSGFYSQGDGLAFDANIDWLPFFEAHPSFKTDLPEWYLLLVANPSYFSCGVRRSGRNSNCMTSQFDEADVPEIVEQGYFAGASLLHEALGLDIPDLEEWILDACQDEAHKMYKGLEEEHDWLCESEKEQRCEEFIDENREVLARCIAALLLEGTIRGSTSRADEVSEGEIDFVDLAMLGLIEHKGGGVWRVSAKGEELVCNSKNTRVGICSNEPSAPCGERATA